MAVFVTKWIAVILLICIQEYEASICKYSSFISDGYSYTYCINGCCSTSSFSSVCCPRTTYSFYQLNSGVYWGIGVSVLVVIVVSIVSIVACCCRRQRGATGVLVNGAPISNVVYSNSGFQTGHMQQPAPYIVAQPTGYYPAQPGYNPSTPGYNPSTPGYNPSTPGYNPSTPGYNPSTPGYNPSTPGNNIATPGNNVATPGNNASKTGYNPSPYDQPNPAATPTNAKTTSVGDPHVYETLNFNP